MGSCQFVLVGFSTRLHADASMLTTATVRSTFVTPDTRRPQEPSCWADGLASVLAIQASPSVIVLANGPKGIARAHLVKDRSPVSNTPLRALPNNREAQRSDRWHDESGPLHCPASGRARPRRSRIGGLSGRSPRAGDAGRATRLVRSNGAAPTLNLSGTTLRGFPSMAGRC